MENSETSKCFWAIVEKAALRREKLKEILIAFSKEEIIRFQEEFVDASIELQCEPYTDYMEESEDGREDIANWVVSNGENFYFEILDKPEKIPHNVSDFTEQILYGIADEVCLEKYGESTGIYT